MTNAKRILVTGATGNTGRLLVPRLVAAGHKVRALVRDPARAGGLREAGAEVVAGDPGRPDTLGPAVRDVDRIYLCTWNGPDEAVHGKNLIAAAREAGRPHVVRHSAWGTESSRIIQNHRAIEAALAGSGLPWTFLRPTFYMQGTMMAAGTVASQGMIYLPMKAARLAMVDVRDIADVAARVLIDGGHEGKTYRLTGPEGLSFDDVAAALSRELGKPVRYMDVPPQAGREFMLGMGMLPWIVEGYVELLQGFAEGFASEPSDDVTSVTGAPARTYARFAADFRSAFVAAAA